MKRAQSGHYPAMIKTLWSSVQGNPVFMRRMNGWLTIVWIVMIPVSFATGWVKSVAYVSALSLWHSCPATGPLGKPHAWKSHKSKTKTATPLRMFPRISLTTS